MGSRTADEVNGALNAIGDPELLVNAVEAYVDSLPDAQRHEFAEIVRAQAADEGCRWSELEGADIDGVQDIAGWDNIEFAEIVRDKGVEFAARRGELDQLHQAALDEVSSPRYR